MILTRNEQVDRSIRFVGSNNNNYLQRFISLGKIPVQCLSKFHPLRERKDILFKGFDLIQQSIFYQK